LEALLGATSGGKEERREELIRYQIYLTLLLERRDGVAQKALDEFKMMDGSPALYYAQAAWAFQHGNPKQAQNWVANASNLYSPELNRAFAAPLADLGWTNNAVVPVASTKTAPVMAQNIPIKTEATPSATAAPNNQRASPPPAVAQTETEKPAESPEPKPEVSATPKKLASAKTKEKERSTTSNRTKKKRMARKKSGGEDEAAISRAKQTAAAEHAAGPLASPPIASPTPPSLTLAQTGATPTRENLGDKVRNLVLYPFRHREEKTPSPTPPAPVMPNTTISSTPTPERRPNN
jgi:hypothetical protein